MRSFLKSVLESDYNSNKIANVMAEEVTVGTEPIKPATKYPKVVMDIHNEFLTAGDKLLVSANEVLSSISIPNQKKINQLRNFGFGETAEVKLVEVEEEKKRQNEELAKAITDLQKQYPLYKIITHEVAKTICEKYNLVLGDVSQYKAFVPQKNLDEIETFFKNHSKDECIYFKTDDDYYDDDDFDDEDIADQFEIITKEQYEIGLTSKKSHRFYKKSPLLNICAPLKDMNSRGYSVKNNVLVKDVPDPIVMLRKTIAYNTYYIIITAWGDEASDENVVNHNNN